MFGIRSVSRNSSTRYDISILVLNIRDMDTTSRYVVSCDITWYGIWDHDISRYIMRYDTGSPRNTTQIQIQRKPTTSLRSTPVFSALSPPLSWLVLRLAFFVVILLSISWTHHLVMDRPYHQQTATLSPRNSVSYLSACLFSIHFYIFLLLSWYSLAVTRYLVYCCYWRSRALFLVQYLVAEREIVDVV